MPAARIPARAALRAPDIAHDAAQNAAQNAAQDAAAAAKLERLEAILEAAGRVIVAYSGGVDSAFLLRVAHDKLGGRVLGVLGVSESLDANESRAALAVASAMGVPVRCVDTREYESAAYRANDGSRCYHCKTELFSVLGRMALEEGYDCVLDGSNADDAGDFRPGARARDEQGVRSPLQEVGLTKDEIRALSRRMGLPTWDKPAAPCLSSRIPYGTPITRERLRQVEAAEAALREAGFRVCRVRHHERVARIEVPLADLPRLIAPGVRERIVERLEDAGFTFVTVDIEGFRSGALNEALGAAEREAALQPAERRPIDPSEIRMLS